MHQPQRTKEVEEQIEETRDAECPVDEEISQFRASQARPVPYVFVDVIDGESLCVLHQALVLPACEEE